MVDEKQVVPHEMASAEFAQYASATKLINHGRQWEVFVGDRSFGFSDAATAELAIKDAHKSEVNNALYSNSRDETNPAWKTSMPPIRVMMEYPDLDEKFKDVFFLMKHKATWEAVAAISGDNVKQSYEKAGLTFERDGRFAIVKKDGLSVAHMTPQFNRQQLYDAMIGNLQSGAQHIAGILENAYKELKVPDGYSFIFDPVRDIRQIASFRNNEINAFVRLVGENVDHVPDQLAVELRVFLDEPRAYLFATKGPRFFGQNVSLLEDKEPSFYAASYEALASNLVTFFNNQVLERAGLSVTVLNDRYADSIIGDRGACYDGLEIQGVRDLNLPGDPSGTCCEVDNENPQFYSVYAHLIPEGDNGGIECVGDFGTHALAVEYAVELGQQYGWDVRDFSKDGVCMSGQYSGAILAVDNGRVTQKVDRHGQTVSHLASLLSKDVQVGEVVDIKYHGGKGVVAAKDLGVGVGR